tara:strand:+ start:636 stop:6038 length:5403 start_codon:yes stop_codon:yes gene_type:complete
MIDLSQYSILKDDLTAGVTNAEHLIRIGGRDASPIYIATKKQMFDAGTRFYEDRDLKISKISERINLRTKKIQLSNISITLTNFPASVSNEDRISNNPALAIGATIDVWLKTQSCQSTSDCIRVAKLKITRIEHDEKKVKINADDISMQAFSQNLPQDEYILRQAVDTYEHYNAKPVPILYGHLEAAPATIYVENINSEDSSVKVLVDTSYLNPSTSKICGIKNLGFAGEVNGAWTNSPTNWSYEAGGGGETVYGKFLEDNDTLKIGVDEKFCSVLAVPSWNASAALFESYNMVTDGSYMSSENIYAHPQYIVDNYDGYAFLDNSSSDMNSITLISETATGTLDSNPTLLTKGALWVNHLSDYLSKSGIVLNSISQIFTNAEDTTNVENYYYPAVSDSEKTEFLDIHTSVNFGDINEDWATTFEYQKCSTAIETLNFEPFSGAEIYFIVDGEGNNTYHPVDIGLVGLHHIESVAGNIYQTNGNKHYFSGDVPHDLTCNSMAVFGFPSKFKINTDMQGLGDFGVDKSLWLTGALQADDEIGYPDEISPYMMPYEMQQGTTDFPYSYAFDTQRFHDFYSPSTMPSAPLNHFHTTNVDQGGTTNSYQAYLYGDLFNELNKKTFGHHMEYMFINEEGLLQVGYSSHFSLIDVTQISFYMMHHTESDADIGDADITSYWKDVRLKKTWAESNIFSKDFFVNAKGKRGDGFLWYSDYFQQYNQTERVSGIIEILWGNEDGSFNKSTNNTHFHEFHKIFTDTKLKTRLINGKLYERMLVSLTELPDGTITKAYLYDVDIHNLGLSYGENGNGGELIVGTPSGGTLVDIGEVDSSVLHSKGWDIRFSGYLFGDVPQISGSLKGAFFGLRIVWARKNYFRESGNKRISSITESPEDQNVEFSAFNDSNGCPWGTVSNYYGANTYQRRGYTMAYWNCVNTDYQNLAENPAEIIKDVVENEIGNVVGFEDLQKYNNALNSEQNNKFAFSINESTPAKDVIEDICRQSRLFFRHRVSDGSPVIDAIRNTYNNGDVNKLIDSDMILKYQFSKTRIENLCFGGVTVKYAYNYLTKEYDGVVATKYTEEQVDSFKNLYDVDNHLDYRVEIDTPYIQDETTAKILMNYLYELNKNQHLTCKLTLPLKEGVELEVGDIVRFSKDPGGVKPFGKTVTSSHSIGNTDQKALPYFMITSASKSLTEVNLELYQFNELKIITLNPTLPGDINQNGWVNETDYELLADYLAGMDIEISEQGLANADINQDGVIDEQDLSLLSDLIDEYQNTGLHDEDMEDAPDRPWDVNGDGYITTHDFQAIWQYVTNMYAGTVDPPNVAWMENADANLDGSIDWADYIAGLHAYPTVAQQMDFSSEVPGDIDGDGVITSIDLLYLQLHLQEIQGFTIQEGNPHYVNLPDFDNDGVTDWEDYDILLAEYNNINGEFFQVPGDLTMNGEVNIRDIIYHLKIFDGVATPTDTQVLNGDLNGNGFIDTGATSGLPHDLIAFLLGQFENGINYCTTNEYQEGFINGALLTQDDFDKIQEYTLGSYLNGLGLEAFVSWYKDFHQTDYEITIQDYVNLCGASNIENIGLFPTSQLNQLQELIDSDSGGSESDPFEGYFELASTSHGTDLQVGQASLNSVTLGKYDHYGINAINFKFDTDYTATSDDHVFAPDATWQSLYTKIHNTASYSLGYHPTNGDHEEKTDLIIRTSFIGSDEDLIFVQTYQNGQRWDVCQAFLALDGMTIRNCRIQPSGGLVFFRLEADTISHPDDFNWIGNESFSLGGVEYNYEVNDKIPSELAMFFKIDIYAPENYWENNEG